MERLTERLENGVINVKYAIQHETAIHRLVTIEDILGDDYDLDRLRELVQAERVIRKEIWAEARYLHIFTTKPGDVERAIVQYVSLLRDGNILCHTKTCAFSLSEIGKTVFTTREAAEQALKEVEKDG